MLCFVIRGVILPHPPEQLQPAFAQAAQSAGVVMAFVPFGLIIGLGPVALFAGLVHPQVDGMAQEVITGEAKVRFAKLARLIGDRADPSLAHQAVGIRKEVASGADLAQQPRAQDLFSPGQGAKDVMVGMLLKSLGNARAILLDLALEDLEHLDPAQGQSTET